MAVVDVDFHHGNGTQDVFWEDPEVLYVSLHGDPAGHYPHFTGAADETGGGAGPGTNRNLPLPDGTGDDAYLAALGEAMDVVAGFDPATLVVSAGFDTFAGDPIGAFQVTTEGFRRIGAALAAAGRPTVVVQEGGYAVEALGANALALLGGSRRPSERPYPPTRSFARYVLTTASQASRLALLRLTAAGCAKVGHVGGQPARQGFESPHPDFAGPATARPPGGFSPARRGARPGRRRAGGAGRSSARGR